MGKHLNRYQVYYFMRYNKKFYRKNKHWKKDWMPFIKYDKNDSGDYLIELIVYKLHMMYDYYLEDKNVRKILPESAIQRRIDTLEKACNLGDELMSLGEPTGFKEEQERQQASLDFFTFIAENYKGWWN